MCGKNLGVDHRDVVFKALGLDEIKGEGVGRLSRGWGRTRGEEEEQKRGEVEGREWGGEEHRCHVSGPGEHTVRLTQALGPGAPSLRGGGHYRDTSRWNTCECIRPGVRKRGCERPEEGWPHSTQGAGGGWLPREATWTLRPARCICLEKREGSREEG